MLRRRLLLELLAVALLGTSALLLVRDHQRLDSPTLDEPYHVFAGSEYAADGTFWLNPEHPPLVKLLAGSALAPLRLSTPDGGRPLTRTPHPEFLRFVYANRAPAHVIIQHARRPMPWVLLALVVVTWAAGRALFGAGAGLLAASLVALDPNFLGHAALVHTDVPAALTMTAAVLLGTLAASRAGLALWGAAGVTLGIALATKFTAVLLVPVFVLLPLLAARQRPWRRNAAGAALALVVGTGTLAAVYEIAMRRMDGPAAENAVRWYLGSRGASPPVVERYAAFSRAAPPLAHWAAGLKGVALLSETTRGWNFLHGRTYQGANLSYFPIAFAIKSAPAFLLLLLLAAALARRELLRFSAVALLVPAALVFASAMTSSFNIGQRHLFPVYPLLAVVASGSLAARLPARRFAAIAGGLVLLSALSVARVHPDELSYFNFLVGGPEGGARWLTDSNVDWGQDMARLSGWLAARGGEETTTVVAYSGLATNYFSRRVRVLDSMQSPGPGRYVLGRTLEALGLRADAFLPDPAQRERLAELIALLHDRGRQVDRVGGSLTVWELPAVEMQEGRSSGEAPRR